MPGTILGLYLLILRCNYNSSFLDYSTVSSDIYNTYNQQMEVLAPPQNSSMPYIHPEILATIDHFSSPTTLPFSKSHVNGIMQFSFV